MNTPQNINQIISFQNASVVSKEIINKTTGTITLFAFDKNQGLNEHTTPYDALVIATEGTAEITISNIKHQIEVGEILLLPANAPHVLKATKPFKMILVMIRS